MAFVRCDYLDKIHLCTNHGFQEYLWPMEGVNLHLAYGLISEAIYTCIPENIKLRELYLKWVNLCAEDQFALVEKFCERDIPSGGFDLFMPLRRAFSHWDQLQNMQGAPGIQKGLHAFSCNRSLNEDLEYLIVQIDQYIDQIID